MKEGQETVRQVLVLGILMWGKTHGYRLNEYVAHASGVSTSRGKSSVYYTLRKLEKGGYVHQELEREGKRPERQVYQITEKGRALFLGLLREHLGDFSPTHYLDDVGTAFLDHLSNEEARQLLTVKRDKIQVAMQQMREHSGSGGDWRHVIRRNVAHLDTELAWVNRVLDELDV